MKPDFSNQPTLSSAEQPRSRRTVLWLTVALLLVLTLLLAYRFLRPGGNRAEPLAEQGEEDPLLIQDLQHARLGTGAARGGSPGDWPQWRGPLRDGRSEEKLAAAWPPEGPKVLWRTAIGLGYSCPVIVGERLFTLERAGDDEAVICRDCANAGVEVWHFSYPCPYQNEHGSGPRSTPTVDGDLVFAVGATGIVHCLKASTGEKVWRHDLGEEFHAFAIEHGASFSPLVEGELVYAVAGGPNGQSLLAFNKRSGRLVWKALDDPPSYSSPIAVTAAGVRQIIFLTGMRLVSVAPETGRLYWSFPWDSINNANVATPIAVGDYLFISTGYGNGCALLKIVAEDPDHLRIQRVYTNGRMRNYLSSCVCYRDYLYGFHDHLLTCMDLRTGKVRWSTRGFQRGSLLIADGEFVVLSEDGRLARAPATPEGFHEQASFEILKQKCWTVPVLAHGRLYVRTENQLFCFDVKP